MRSAAANVPVIAVVAIVVVGLIAVVTVVSSVNGADAFPFANRLPASPFPKGLSWINTARPISLDALHGKFVLLDFWTLGCINCMHIIPELRKIEEKWPNELVVIGVHSAKFAGERQNASIKAAVSRYGVKHPVVNDSEFAIWKAYGIQAWPSLVLIEPEGNAVWGHSGEITFEQLDSVLTKAVPYYRARRLLRETPVRFEAESHEADQSPLRFPGKVLADPVGQRLFVADTGHHRIVITRFDGSPVETIGAGARGHADGDFASATFNAPQGMALDGDLLYVADTENHMIRTIDLKNRKVATITGTGEQNRNALPFGRMRKPLATSLSSPWALCIHDKDLYIAMAGVHQIWLMKLDGSGITVYAGNGTEDIVDGRLRPRRWGEPGYVSFALPSGLATDGQWLYVADSEGSSIRAVPFDPRQNVKTVVGTARLPTARLFTYGDVDGPASEVRLQHPLGIAYDNGKLYVADTYNSKIKVIDPVTGETHTLLENPVPQNAGDPVGYDQPGGISAAEGKLFVADTNHHLIRVVDLSKSSQE